MNRSKIYALIIIGLTAVMLIFNRQSVLVDLRFTEVHGIAALVYLFFISLGVAIGLLLK